MYVILFLQNHVVLGKGTVLKKFQKIENNSAATTTNAIILDHGLGQKQNIYLLIQLLPCVVGTNKSLQYISNCSTCTK